MILKRTTISPTAKSINRLMFNFLNRSIFDNDLRMMLVFFKGSINVILIILIEYILCGYGIFWENVCDRYFCDFLSKILKIF